MGPPEMVDGDGGRRARGRKKRGCTRAMEPAEARNGDGNPNAHPPRAFIGGTAPSPAKRPRVPAKEDSVPARKRRSRGEDGVGRDGGGEENEWR
jgi:hypothetical protein